MRVHVAFTPDEVLEAPVAVVVDVMRATSTIAQALASGYERVYCCREIEDARALRERLGEGLLGGERSAVQIEGFDIGASPREVLEPRGSTLIYSTTNGTRSPRGAWTTPRSPARSRRRGASTARICGAHRGHRRRSA